MHARKFDDDDYDYEADGGGYDGEGEEEEEERGTSSHGDGEGEGEGSVFEAALEDVRRAVEARMGDIEGSVEDEVGGGDENEGEAGQGTSPLVPRAMVDQVTIESPISSNPTMPLHHGPFPPPPLPTTTTTTTTTTTSTNTSITTTTTTTLNAHHDQIEGMIAQLERGLVERGGYQHSLWLVDATNHTSTTPVGPSLLHLTPTPTLTPTTTPKHPLPPC